MSNARKPESRATYFRRVMERDVEWLRACAADPSAYMRKRHIDLIRLAIRKKEGGR